MTRFWMFTALLFLLVASAIAQRPNIVFVPLDGFGYGTFSCQSPTLAVREDNWKFRCKAAGSRAELYDLHRDAKESNHLIATQAKGTATMQKRLLAWHKSLPDVQPK